MLSWVVKVVPQPPEPPPKNTDKPKEEEHTAPPSAPAPPPVNERKVTFEDENKPAVAPKPEQQKQEALPAEGNSPASGSQSGVLMWISDALPQPTVSPKVTQPSSTSKEENTASKPEDERGVIAWIVQGLDKVVPHPDLKTKEPPAATEHPTEVCLAPAAPEPQVVKVEPEGEDSKPLPPRMIDWIKQGFEKVVPQPEIHTKTEKTEAPPPSKAEAPAEEAPPPVKPANSDKGKGSKSPLKQKEKEKRDRVSLTAAET